MRLQLRKSLYLQGEHDEESYKLLPSSSKVAFFQPCWRTLSMFSLSFTGNLLDDWINPNYENHLDLG